MAKYHVVLEDNSGDFFADAMVEAPNDMEAADRAADIAESLEWHQRDYTLDTSRVMVLDSFLCNPETEITCTQEVD